ncbi:hypothetical protein [Bacillus halotolerans]|uniref:hypothetical protein n=1 Tax=Bacillus halotolerans TaxID=260554 RepID=UPI002DBFC6D0|nr:hypothetical protein [Bacillus halotolerans]MEC1665515.1 hypothetical protein [Bacillus halotolerans]
MSWLEFISSIIKSIAWPIIVLIAVLALRKPVSQLILKLAELKLKTVKYGEFEATFEDKLEDAESNVNPEADTSENGAEEGSSEITDQDRLFANIAEEAPHLGVVLSWQELEFELNKATKRLGLNDSLYQGVNIKRPASTIQTIKYLVSQGYLNKNFYKSLKGLQQLRNFAVHRADNDYLITFEEAIRYRKLTKTLIKELQSLTPDHQVASS